MLITIWEQTHEVDSIIDISGPKHGYEQQFKLEMCCPCCRGRIMRFKRKKLMEHANEPLRNLAE